MQMTRETIESILTELGEWLELEKCDPVEWVVCGGTALMLQNLRIGTTEDVDVLGNWNAEIAEIACIHDFSDPVKACIQRVVENHPTLKRLRKPWVNLGPATLAEEGLPNGFEARLRTRRFGSRLALHLLGRVDLLALKLYAAADEFSPRRQIHFDDLKALNPTFQELDSAVEWARTRRDFEQVRTEMKQVARDLGYDDLAYYI